MCKEKKKPGNLGSQIIFSQISNVVKRPSVLNLVFYLFIIFQIGFRDD